MTSLTILNLYNLLKKNYRFVLLVTFIGTVISFSVSFLIQSEYEQSIIFRQPNADTRQINQVRFLLNGSNQYAELIVPKLENIDGLTVRSFREKTILVQKTEDEIQLVQSFHSPQKVKKVMEQTSQLLQEKYRWEVIDQSQVIERVPPFKRITSIGFLVSFFFAIGAVVAQVDFFKRYLKESSMELLAANLVEVKHITPLYFIIKRLMDIFIGCIGLIPFAIGYIFLYIPYSFGENKGPILFRQKRYGVNGEFFYIYKFRSMRVGAEEILKADPKLWERYVAGGYKLPQEEDPRITRLGRFIRKTSLDEFPQFINVVRGDMSLIGPRPIISEELSEYGERKSCFLAMKPGITGVWGISGRSNLDYPERADVELSYLSRRSIKYDFYVIFKTALGVIKKDGAY
ncbi:MAG: sugar transferase [Streptococcaceae bacterium]|jgi:lipopolysaccharide/colanic/teichoic acid biosynthesis glycosyltransferase|nr:sugar transferase [Streptococcaceae bacterium]